MADMRAVSWSHGKTFGVIAWIIVVFQVSCQSHRHTIHYQLDTLRWYDPYSCYVTDGPTLFTPVNETSGSRPGSRDHWREHERKSSCSVELLTSKANNSECGKLLLRRSLLPLMLETMNTITAHAQLMWQPIFSEYGLEWTLGARDQLDQYRVEHIKNELKILWDILAFKESKGTKGAELTSQDTWHEYLNVPVHSDLDTLSQPLWDLYIRLNRHQNNLLPMLDGRMKQVTEHASQLTLDAKMFTGNMPDHLTRLEDTVRELQLMKHFFENNDRRIKSHRKYYLELRRRVKELRNLRKTTTKIAKARRKVEEHMFITLRPYERVRSWIDKATSHRMHSERMRYRVTFGDVKSNILDMKDQLVWIKRDTKQANKILSVITPDALVLQENVEWLKNLTFEDYTIYNIQTLMKQARFNYQAVIDLSAMMLPRISDLNIKCAYLYVIQAPSMFEKARVDLALGALLGKAAFAINEGRDAINSSRQYVAFKAFMLERYDPCNCSPIEKDLDYISDTLKDAAEILRDYLSKVDSARPEVLPSALEREGFLPASSARTGRHLMAFDDAGSDDVTNTEYSENRSGRRLLWWLVNQKTTTDGPTTTTTTRTTTKTTVITTTPPRDDITTASRTTTVTTARPSDESTSTSEEPATTTGKPTKNSKPTEKPKPTKKPKPTEKPPPPKKPKPTKSSQTTKPPYEEWPSRSSTIEKRSTTDPPPDFTFSGSGFGSGDGDEELPKTTHKPVTSSTTTQQPIPAITHAPRPDWAGLKKMIKKTAKSIKKAGNNNLKQLENLEYTTDGMLLRVNTTDRAHDAIKIAHKTIHNNLHLAGLDDKDDMSALIRDAADDVARRQTKLANQARGIVFDNAPFMEEHRKILVSLGDHAEGSSAAMDHEMRRLTKEIRVVDVAGAELYRRAVRMNDTMLDVAHNLQILRERIQTARMAISGIHSKIQVTGVSTYTFQHDILSGDFKPDSMHVQFRTLQPDGALVSIQGPQRLRRRSTRQAHNRLSLGISRGHVTLYVEAWHRKWSLPNVVNDARWHQVGIYILENSDVVMTDNVMTSNSTKKYTEVQRRVFPADSAVNIRQFFTKRYLFSIGKLPHASWPFNPDPAFRACVSGLQVGGHYLPMYTVRTSRGQMAPRCVGETVTSKMADAEEYREKTTEWLPPRELSVSSPLTKNMSNAYTLHGGGDEFMFKIEYKAELEGGVVAFLALSSRVQISLHYRHRRIVVTLIDGDRFASAVCRTYGSHESTHSIFAVASNRRVEISVDCRRCQSLPAMTSIYRDFPFHKPELLVAPSSDQLDYYLYQRPRARQQVAPFNGVVHKVIMDGVVLYNFPSDTAACLDDVTWLRHDHRHQHGKRSRRRRRRMTSRRI